jgi:hypothetical protein
MNKRFKELATEARLLTGWPVGEIEYQKFAELIVRECAEIAVFKDSGTVATADVAGHMAAGRSIAARLIKEHFGVEE